MTNKPFPEWPLAERMAYNQRIELEGENHAEKPELQVIRETHTIDHELAAPQVRDLGRLLVGMGREVEVHMNTTSLPGVPFKTGKRAGEMRPDRVFDNYALATVDKRLPVVYAVWAGDKASSPLAIARFAMARDRVYDARNITELKQWIRNGVASDDSL